ncbi:hypothetical protein GEMRC1_005895 [Eukaryota sp. GEM-RC1]
MASIYQGLANANTVEPLLNCLEDSEDNGRPITSIKLSSTTISSLSRTPLSDTHISPIVELVLTYKPLLASLSLLDLAYNNITSTSLPELANLLSSSSISTLILSSNLITDSWSPLFSSLPSSNLSTLNLSNNIIPSTDASLLATVHPNTRLTSLNLSNTGLSDPDLLTFSFTCLMLIRFKNSYWIPRIPFQWIQCCINSRCF